MFADIITLLGSETASRLVADFGGRRLYVPQYPGGQDALSRSIGLTNAIKLSRVYGGDRIEVPRQPARRTQILSLRAAGCSIGAIAHELACTRRRVLQVLAEARRAGFEISARH
jgi:hypothetical protein